MVDDLTLQRAIQGQRDAVETVLGEVIDQVHAICYRMVGASDADDATQRSMISIAKGLPRFKRDAKFETWCFRVATNACLDELRARKRRPVASESLEDAPSGSDDTDAVAMSMDLQAALQSLAPEYQSALVLAATSGLDYAQIGEALGVSVGTVKSRVSRAREKVAAMIGDQGTDRPAQTSKDSNG